MQNRNIRYIAGLLVLVMLCGLFACKAGTPEPAPEATATAVQITTAEETMPLVAEADAAQRREMLQAYQTVLTDLLQKHVLPDGTDCGYDDFSDTTENQFAVSDVDNDGLDELIVAYTTTYIAGQTQGIFGYRDGRITTELTEFPLLTFFDNGVIQAGWSHNQGLAASFWPYNLYGYDTATDAYKLVGVADAWEKAFAPKDYDGNPYPDELDAIGAGVVYFIRDTFEQETPVPVDETAYAAWRAAFLENAVEMQIPYERLTEENIAALLP